MGSSKQVQSTVRSAAKGPEEFTLVKAVVDDLTAERPKLKYADWLVQQGDPRGVFLREFVAAARSDGKQKLPSSGAFLDAWRHTVGVTLIEQIHRYKLFKDKNAILAAARPALGFSPTPTEEKQFKVGDTRLGGRPDLPSDLAWPVAPPPGAPYPPRSEKLLVFIGQFQLADFALTQTSRDLPKEGLLSFFVVDDVDGGVVGNASWHGVTPVEWSVVFSAESASLVRRDPPAGIPTRPACTLTFMETLGLPERAKVGVADEFPDEYNNVKYQLRVDSEFDLYANSLLGYVNPGVIHDPTPDPSWRHLASFFPDEDRNGWFWANQQLMFLIRDEALQKQEFDQVMAVNG